MGGGCKQSTDLSICWNKVLIILLTIFVSL